MMPYQVRLVELQAQMARGHLRQTLLLAAFVAALAALVLLGGLWIAKRMARGWPAALFAPLAGVAIWRYGTVRKRMTEWSRLEEYYRRGLLRMEGHWAGQGWSGEEFAEPGHMYAADLDCFGAGSLFERMCTARTQTGRGRLAEYLQTPAESEEIRRRQWAVEELRGRADLRERMVLLGRSRFADARAEAWREWLDAPRENFAGGLRVTAAVSSALLAACLLSSITIAATSYLLLPYMAALLLFHTILALAVRRRVARVLERTRQAGGDVAILREGLEMLQKQQFGSAKLRAIVEELRSGDGPRAMRMLIRWVRILEERQKEYFYPPSLALLCGTQCAMAIEAWRERYGALCRGWVAAWAEFEALNSVGCYASERVQDTWPEVEEGPAGYEAEGLGHPLLNESECVRNDVRLGGGTRFLIVSGSNMAGKSTLLRSIGINAVLAQMGAPVCARRLRISGLRVMASISVLDSLLEGKSKFLMELERLRHMIEASGGPVPVLYLVDELLSGTNSTDRRAAAEAVVRTLAERGALGALSTHDLSLAEIAGVPGSGGLNVHMGSRAGGNPLDFDYVLKPGVSRERNALAIARMAGVPV